MSLKLSDLAITLPGAAAPLFAPLTLEVVSGQMGVILGPSGIGKSTLLDAIGGHLVPGICLTGAVHLKGRDMFALPAEKRRIGLLFQDALLFPHLSVGDNLAFGLTATVRGRAARHAAVAAALEQAGLAGMAGRDPATLSGGQRARAALMRTLLAEPDAVLLDEPFSRLDTGLRAEIRDFAVDHIARRSIPALLVTHDPEDAGAAGGPVTILQPFAGQAGKGT